MMLVIYGPTAAGKTDLAIKLAKKYQGELISADSRQVYKDLDIGTGKVSFTSKVEKHSGFWIVDKVKIHGFDLMDTGDPFSAADFVKFARTTITQIINAEKLPIIVGGSGFYIKAFIERVGSIGISQNPLLRKKLEKLTREKLFQKLLDVDPNRVKSMNESDKANPRRLIRAIEIALSNQKTHFVTPNSISSEKLQNSYKPQTANYKIICLTATNSVLYDRADKWLELRLRKGMIEEVENLIKSGIDSSWLESLGLEYRWLTRFLLGKITKEQAVERLKGDIHSFIRRQKTWFKQFKKTNINIFDISQKDWRAMLEKTVKYWYTQENG